tara:strand:- start:6389 stop:6553 length:165 start_codon:yes stop_codon:yes gene_type:complete
MKNNIIEKNILFFRALEILFFFSLEKRNFKNNKPIIIDEMLGETVRKNENKISK